MTIIDHEKLDVYKAGISFVVLIDRIIATFPKGRSYLADQLLRAGTSVPLNIAEGAGEFSINEKVRFYRIAKRSATECASIIDVCRNLQLVTDEQYQQGRELIIRIIKMLTKMAQINQM